MKDANDLEYFRICLAGNSTLEPWRTLAVPTRVAQAVNIPFEPGDVFGAGPPDPAMIAELEAEGVEYTIADPMVFVTAEMLCQKLQERIQQLEPKQSEKSDDTTERKGNDIQSGE